MRTELEVKYDILRGENYRLSRKLDHYESGKAFETLQRKHDEELRSLKYKLQRSEAAYAVLSENNRRNVDEIGRLRDVIAEKDSELDGLVKEYEGMLDEYKNLIDELRKQIEDMEGKMKKMSAQLNRDYTNSSVPSSKEENHKKIANSRVRSGKKPGAQCGHKPSFRKMMEPTEPVIHLVPIEAAENPEEWEELTMKRVRQVIDTRMTVTCVQYEAHAYKNRKTNKIIYSAFPANVVNEVNYGEGIKALCCLMTTYCNVSVRKTHELMRSLTDGKLNISAGTISNLPKELKNKTAEERTEIIQRLMKSGCLHSDATSIRINGEKWNIYVTANDTNVIYTLSKVKGIEGIKATPLKNYLNAVIHDHDKSYYNEEFAFSNHQECLAHILRYLQDSIDNEPEYTWNDMMKRHLQLMIHRYKSGDLQDDEKEQFIRTYDEILQIAENEYKQHPATKYYREGFNLAKRLKEYRNETLAFLTSETDMEYENNLSERLLRACKRKSRAVISFRSVDSVSAYCDVMSLIKSAEQNNENIYQLLRKGFTAS